MQRERVEEQYPWTWEIPLAVVCAIIALGVAACQLARSIANWFAGAGWRWPAVGDLVTSLPGLLAGDAAAGLSGVHPVASSGILWAWLGVTGLLTTTLLTVAGVCGPGIGGGRHGCAAWRRLRKRMNSSGRTGCGRCDISCDPTSIRQEVG